MSAFLSCRLGGIDVADTDPATDGATRACRHAHATAVPGQYRVTVLCSPVHDLRTTIPRPLGADAASPPGLRSGTGDGPSRAALGSERVRVGGVPVVAQSAPTLQNGRTANAAGVALRPAQARLATGRPFGD